MEPYWIFSSVVFGFYKTSPHTLQPSADQENAAKLFGCEAPKTICNLQNFTQLSISMGTFVSPDSANV